MSWLYSQALVAEYLEENFLDGEQSVPSNGNPTPQAYCAPDKMTEFCRLSRFGMTYKPLMDDLGKELLTSYLAAFPVKTSALQEKGQGSQGNDQECGATWRASLAKYDQDSCSWKTVQHSLFGDLESSSVTWPKSGMTAAGQCWELPTLERHTSGTDSGLWRTPQSGDSKSSRVQAGHQMNLTHQVLKLAAPILTWPTPTVCGNYNRKGASATSGDGLATAVLKCATPTARDWRSGKASQATMERNSRPWSEQIGGSLNPMWVEWLMGWPLGWTDLKPLATDKCLYVPQQLGDC